MKGSRDRLLGPFHLKSERVKLAEVRLRVRHACPLQQLENKQGLHVEKFPQRGVLPTLSRFPGNAKLKLVTPRNSEISMSHISTTSALDAKNVLNQKLNICDRVVFVSIIPLDFESKPGQKCWC